MAGRLEGKVCVITGAGGGMGREGAFVFTSEGAKVCVADIDYARPLIEGEVKIPIESGLPKYVTLEKVRIEKKLPPRE